MIEAFKIQLRLIIYYHLQIILAVNFGSYTTCTLAVPLHIARLTYSLTMIDYQPVPEELADTRPMYSKVPPIVGSGCVGHSGLMSFVISGSQPPMTVLWREA